ncbi:MAG: class I SAM-dependent methyltransferase [Clostridia bacterium]|nr:class I SAM-dependent methyltransferase [Clostridia bacterium]
MFCWNEDMLRFMTDASEHTDYYRALTELLSPYLPKNGHICDAGCGMGYLSEQLAAAVKQVTAVDISESAIAQLQLRLSVSPRENLLPICADITKLTPKAPYDAMVFCLFGSIQSILEIGRNQCRGKLLIVKKNYSMHRFSLGQNPLHCYRFCDAVEILDRLGLPYEAIETDLELGQPLRSLEDAVLFFRTYSKDAHPEAITEEAILPRLWKTDDPDFPYYLPQNKKMGILIIDAAAIPAQLPWEEQ